MQITAEVLFLAQNDGINVDCCKLKFYHIDRQVFCDKGAERKARDEERRASKRRTTPSGKRRLDEMYHTPLERSEFYSMVDVGRPPVTFLKQLPKYITIVTTIR